MRKSVHLYIYICILALLSSCAQVVPLTGGDKDQQPPKLIEAIPANQTLNFTGNKVVLKFDEYVQLRDIFNQLIITPQLNEQPEITAKGKSIEIQFKEPLKKETTYKVYFGNAISDITEGNVLNDFEYVLSTGASIDTLKLKGKTIDAFTLKDLKDITIGLYQDTNDSIIVKSKPDYIAKTKSDGTYIISNIKSGAYKAIAIADNNKNYLYDMGELIGFSDNDIQLDVNKNIDFNLFKEEPKKVFIKKAEHIAPEKVLLVLNGKNSKLNSISIKNTKGESISDYLLKSNRNSDSLHIYFKNIPADSIYIYMNENVDGTLITFQTKEQLEKQFERKRYPLELKSLSAANGSLPVYAALVLHSSFLIGNYDITKTILVENGKEIGSIIENEFVVKGDSIYITKKWKEDSEYKLQLLPGTIKDNYNRTNDTLLISFKTNSKSDYGTLILKHSFTYPNLIVQLYNSSSNCAYEKIISDKSGNEIIFTNLLPDTYKIKFIIDANDNRCFNGGDYFNKQQSEKVFMYDKEVKIIADWENEINVQEND
jgi:hypothetical protein